MAVSNSSSITDSHSIDEDDEDSGIERAKQFIAQTVCKIGDTFIHLIKNGVLSNADVQTMLISVAALGICYEVLREETDESDEESNFDSNDDEHSEVEEENSGSSEENNVNSNEYCQGHSDVENIDSEEEIAAEGELKGIKGAKLVLAKVLCPMMKSTVNLVEMNLGVPEMLSSILIRVLCICTLVTCYLVLLHEEDDSEGDSDTGSDESRDSASDNDQSVEIGEREDMEDEEEQNAGEISDSGSNSPSLPPTLASPQRVTGKRNASEENCSVFGSTMKHPRT